MSSAYGQLNDASGTVTAGTTAQQVLAANPYIRYLRITNQSAHPMYVDFGQVATDASIPLNACGTAGDGTGGSIEFKGSQEGGFVPTGFVSLLSGTTGSAFTVKWG